MQDLDLSLQSLVTLNTTGLSEQIHFINRNTCKSKQFLAHKTVDINAQDRLNRKHLFKKRNKTVREFFIDILRQGIILMAYNLISLQPIKLSGVFFRRSLIIARYGYTLYLTSIKTVIFNFHSTKSCHQYNMAVGGCHLRTAKSHVLSQKSQ